MTNGYDRFNSWKGLAYKNKLEACGKGEKPNPVNWHVYASNTCPYSCNFCIMKDRVEGTRLPNETLEKIAKDASDLDVKLIHISGGGEPLTHPYINDFIKSIRKYGDTKIAMSTNGYLLDRLSEQVDHLRVSFNAGRKETYEMIHGVKDSFEKAKKNVRQAVLQKKGKDIGMGYVLTHENYEEVNDFIKIAEDLGVDFVHIRPAYWPEKNKEIIAATKKINPKSDKVDVFSVSDKFAGYWDDNKHICRASPIHAVTDANGEFILCQDRLDLRWGDYNSQSFEEVWNDPKHDELITKAQKDCNIRCVESGLNEMISKLEDNSLRIELI